MSRQYKKKKKNNDSRLTAGVVITDLSSGKDHMSPFMIAGITYDEVALIRLFADEELTDTLKEHCYMLRYPPVSAGPAILSLPLYADYSHLIVREQSQILLWLDKHPEQLNGHLNHHDLLAIMELIATAETISAEMRNKYLS